MTRIDFYTQVEDKARTACRLAAKAYGQGTRITLFCPDAAAAGRLDRMLWTTPPTAFIPHCMAGDPLAATTPVILDHEGVHHLHDAVLLNLRADWPPFFSRFQRLVEIVTRDDDDKTAARNRYRFYRDRGYEITVHDLGKAAS